MAKTTSVAKFAAMVRKMRAERAEAVARITEIDGFFLELGINTGPAVGSAPVKGRRGRPPGSGAGRPAGGGRRKRGSFAMTGEQSVLEFIKANNKPSAADINKHWKGEGRGGKA